jgi:hypothetical protein
VTRREHDRNGTKAERKYVVELGVVDVKTGTAKELHVGRQLTQRRPIYMLAGAGWGTPALRDQRCQGILLAHDDKIPRYHEALPESPSPAIEI